MTRRPTRRPRIEPKLHTPRRRAPKLQLDAPDLDAHDAAARGGARARKKPSPAKAGTKSANRAQAKAGARRRKPARKRSGKGGGSGWFLKLFKRAAYWGLVLGIWAMIAVVGVLGYYASFLPPTSEWKVPARAPNVQIVSAGGALIANRGNTGGEAVRLEQLPPYLPEAVIAIEDRRYRLHFGVDPIGLLRAVYVNYTAGTLVQGGSTITQQLAKNLFLEPDRTLRRKMQEVVLSLWLEARYSKNEILEMYLNRVYLGAGAYGVDAAARRYFGKSARLVTLAEAATLAGLLKAPTRYAPTNNPDLARRRAQVVLAAMHDTGFISAKEAKNAISSPAQVVSHHATASENYAADWIMEQLPSFIGSIDEDVIVDTTLDLDMQNAAETVLRKALSGEEGRKLDVHQGAIVTLDTTGAVKTMIGGVNYAKSQFNRAVNAHRQPGSAFKPFVYLAALENGMTPSTIRVDEAIRLGKWSPKNYTKKHYGPVTLTQALALSLNTVAARLTYELGPKRVIAAAKRLGVTSVLKNNLSISLGTSEVTPLEITAAYAPFANGGYGVVPHAIRRIRTVSGKTLYARRGDGRGRVISPDILAQMNAMMAETLLTGTGRKALLPGRPAGGKTGTSQDFRDAWFIGYTGDLITTVWLGNDNNSPTKRATGGSLPAKIWRDVMLADHARLPVVSLPGVARMPVQTATPSARPSGAVPRPPAALDAGGGGRPIPPPSVTNGDGPIDLLKQIFGG